MKANKHLILTALSCIGVMSVAVVSSFDTTRASKKEVEPEKPLDYIKAYWKDYIPTALVTTATVASIVANHQLTAKDLSAIGTCAAGSLIMANDYKKKIEEHFGKEALDNITREIVRDKEINAQQATDVGIYTQGYINCAQDPSVEANTLFYDEFSDTWFRSSLYSVKNGMYHFNRNFSIRGSSAIDELYEFWGVTPNRKWDVGKYGFDVDMLWDNEQYWIDFELLECETKNGETYYIISLCLLPGVYDEHEGTFIDQEVA